MTANEVQSGTKCGPRLLQEK